MSEKVGGRRRETECIFRFRLQLSTSTRIRRNLDGIGGERQRTVRGTIRGALAMWLYAVVTPFALLFCVFLGFRRLRESLPRRRSKSVAIVVLGDIGRSPRMLYHANSFVAREYQTRIVAYRGLSRSSPPLRPCTDRLYPCIRRRVESASSPGRIRLCQVRLSQRAVGVDEQSAEGVVFAFRTGQGRRCCVGIILDVGVGD